MYRRWLALSDTRRDIGGGMKVAGGEKAHIE